MSDRVRIGTERFYAVNRRQTWREKIGMLIRSVADAFDGRISEAHDFWSIPAIDRGDVYKCIKHGHDHTEKMLDQMVILRVVDCGLAELHPALLERGTND